jgi:hypothetical protein
MRALEVFLLAVPRFAISVFLASPSNIQVLTHTIHFRNVLLDTFLMLMSSDDMAKSELGLGQEPKVFNVENSNFQADFDVPYFIPGISL